MDERDLPTPPVGVALVIRAASDPKVSLNELGRLIEREPTLTINLLRLSNSAAYGAGREVRSVGQATMLLGSRTIRNIAVAHAVRAMSDRVNTGKLNATLFWEDSLRRACAALVIARGTGYEDPSEAFTVGLIQDLGVLMMAVMHPTSSERLQDIRIEAAPTRVAEEVKIIGRTHTEMFAKLGRGWGLPEDLVTAIAAHHDDVLDISDSRTYRLAQIARAADLLADITQTHGSGDSMVRAKAVIESLDSRQPLEIDRLVNDTVIEMAAQSKDLDIHIEEQPTYQELMEGANKALLQINLSYEELTQRLEETIREKEELAHQLEKSNQALWRLATTDPLTSVGNRRCFSETIERLLNELGEHGEPLTIIALDLDHFKKVNDVHGHAAGDDVLVAVAKRMMETIRAEDMVGRLGGEEFGVLLPRCSQRDGRSVAERLRLALKGRPIRTRDGTNISISGSFGAVTLLRRLTADEAMRIVDQATYVSKSNGRDMVTWAPTVGGALLKG